MDVKGSQTLIDAMELVGQDYEENVENVEYVRVYVAQEPMEAAEDMVYVNEIIHEDTDKDFQNLLSIAKPDNYVYQLLLKSQRGIMLLAAYEIDQENIKSSDDSIADVDYDHSIKCESVEDDEEFHYDNEDKEQDDDSLKFSRAYLSGIIIEDEFWHGRYDIGKDRFNFLADSIVDLFPTERKDTYYSESSVVNGVNLCSRGVLYNKYKKIRQECIDLRLLVARKNKKNIAESSFAKLNALKNIENAQIPDKSIDKQFLKNWVETTQERKKLYNNTLIRDIFKRFPSLKTPLGYSLLLKDFEVEEPPSMSFEVAKHSKKSHLNLEIDHNNRNPPTDCLNNLCEFLLMNKELFAFDNVSSSNYLYKLLLSTQKGIMLMAAYKFDQKAIATSKGTDNQENQNEFEDQQEDAEDAEFDDKKCKFNRFHLSSIITEYEFYHGRFDISRQRFEYLVDGIVELFPGERKSMYYRESSKETSQCSKGILYNRYRKLRQECMSLGLLESKKRKRCSSPTEFAHSEIFSDLRVPIMSITSTYLDKWRSLISDRKKLFKDSTIKDLFDAFPSLATPQGHTLLLDDFNQNSELASYSSNFVLKWPMVAKHIIGIAKTKKTELIVQLLESNKNISNNAHEQNLALFLLPIVLGSISVGTKKSDNEWKATDQDCVDSFILHAKDHEDLIKRQKVLKQSYEDHKLPMQPYVAFIGNFSENVTSYVVANDYRYFANSLVEAIDTCFKFTTAIQHPFQRLSVYAWQFLQYYVYGFQVKSIYSSVSDLSNRIDRKKLTTKKTKNLGARASTSLLRK